MYDTAVINFSSPTEAFSEHNVRKQRARIARFSPVSTRRKYFSNKYARGTNGDVQTICFDIIHGDLLPLIRFSAKAARFSIREGPRPVDSRAPKNSVGNLILWCIRHSAPKNGDAHGQVVVRFAKKPGIALKSYLSRGYASGDYTYFLRTGSMEIRHSIDRPRSVSRRFSIRKTWQL